MRLSVHPDGGAAYRAPDGQVIARTAGLSADQIVAWTRQALGQVKA